VAKTYIIKKVNQTGFKLPAIDEARFAINYQNELNTAQFKAVSSIEGNYLVIAGAGTGKTRTLVYRVARLIEMGYDASSILLLTFTRKAAKEMMSRAAALLDNRCSKILGGTFHSFANSTLRKYAKSVGIDSGFTILDQGDSEDVINLIRSKLNLSDKKKRFPNKETIYKVLSLSVNTEKTIASVLEEEYPHFLEYAEKFAEIQKLFNEYKYKNNLLDYDDLLLYLKKFLDEKSETAARLLSSIKFIMVDEYQDTNKLQADIVQGLSYFNHNVMVVGDDSQSIYSFRGANFKNIINFPNLFPNVTLIKLEENYRSTQPILNFTNHIIELAFEKYPKVLFTKKTDGDLPAIISAANENMQSKFIVERILDLREEGIKLNDIAVLFRSSFYSFDLEIELKKANIPFVKFGGMKFIEAAHIKDVLAFIRISENTKDFVSWMRVLVLHEGIGNKTAQLILDEINNFGISGNTESEFFSNKKYSLKLVELFKLIYKLNTDKKLLPANKIELVLEYYLPLFMNKYDDFNKRKKDLDILLNISSNYKSSDEFLSDMAIDPPQDSVVDVESDNNENEFLTLSTIHSAKGLEWHSVFIIHACEGLFPSSQSFGSNDSLEEERRLMYVAATRAKQNLYISYPMSIFDRRTGFTISKPSRFITSLNETLAESWLLKEEF